MTDEARQKLLECLRAPFRARSSFDPVKACKLAADEIERLANKVEELQIKLDSIEIENERRLERKRCDALEGRVSELERKAPW